MPPSPTAADTLLAAVLTRAWRSRSAIACLLWPLSLVFGAIVALRRALYRAGILNVERLPVPVVVIGNLSVGGVGKTPLVIHLVEALRAAGRRPGVISRGYRAAGGATHARLVTAASDPALCGDEPVLIAQRTGVPLAVGADRVAAARLLLAAEPELDLILSDDGLQHYRLGRHVEVVVTDARGWQNGWLLPAGPLREPLRRLPSATALVGNGIAVPPQPTFGLPFFAMRLVPAGLRALRGGKRISVDESMRSVLPEPFHAVAGIGDPERFFCTLEGMGLQIVRHPFDDHHTYSAEDIDYGDGTILTTEKDAVKFLNLGDLPLPVWVLPVEARITPDLGAFVLEKLNGSTSA